MMESKKPLGFTSIPKMQVAVGSEAHRTWFSLPSLDLFLVSFLMLFFELTVIRWVPSNIRLVAYFSNVILISCFLGMGLGCIYKGRHRLMVLFPWLVLSMLVFCRYLGEKGIENPSADTEYIFGGGGHYTWIYVVPIIFVVNALPFVCIGQRLSRAMEAFAPIEAYTINIVGSLFGTILFGAFSLFGSRPVYWFVACFLVVAFLLRRNAKELLLAGFAMCLSGWLVHVYEKPFLWSPYYKIHVKQLSPIQGAVYRIAVNDDTHQAILNLAPDWREASETMQSWKESYDFPYRLTGNKPPLDVLVLGAGSGNDVAAALRNGARRIDAVELDPVIVDLGRKLHPEEPYGVSRVHLVIDDARAFIGSADRRYDLIVFGWLDSHRLFSSLSNVRQDNFVYTVESMRKTKSLLKKDGILVLSFCVGQPWVGSKIFHMLAKAFGWEPRVFALARGGYGRNGAMFVIGSERNRTVSASWPGFIELTDEFGRLEKSEPPTDDWPYLYYRYRALSGEYASTCLILVGLSAAMVAPYLRRSSLATRDAAHFFMMGAAFLLLEVRNITSLALIFGSTWYVTSIVISAVLLTVLIANVAVAYGVGRKRPGLIWIGLFVSTASSLAWNRLATGIGNAPVRLMLTVMIVSGTFVFAGIVFAHSFSRTTDSGAALGFNILGSIVGGTAEYAGLMIGINGLTFIAILFYIVAFVCPRARSGPPSPDFPGSPAPL